MTEVASATRRVIIPPDLNLLALLGRNDEHLKMLESQYDVKATARGHDVTLRGQAELTQLTLVGGGAVELHLCLRTPCWISISCRMPVLASSSNRPISVSSNGVCSAVACTSTNRPEEVITTFMSTSARESSS